MDAKIVTMRVTPREAADIERLAKALGLTRSDVLKHGLAALREQLAERQSSYEMGKDLFGRHGSGRKDSSTRRRARYKAAVRAKHARR
ncbi:MAG: hypothetical protein ACREVS_15015 [Burkholderiales bacterium]